MRGLKAGMRLMVVHPPDALIGVIESFANERDRVFSQAFAREPICPDRDERHRVVILVDRLSRASEHAATGNTLVLNREGLAAQGAIGMRDDIGGRALVLDHLARRQGDFHSVWLGLDRAIPTEAERFEDASHDDVHPLFDLEPERPSPRPLDIGRFGQHHAKHRVSLRRDATSGAFADQRLNEGLGARLVRELESRDGDGH